MPTGCCSGSTCACKIVSDDPRITVDGSGQAGDPFVLNLESGFESGANSTFNTVLSGTGTEADPFSYETTYAATAKLDHIPDVNAPSPTNGQVLAWNSTTSEWVAQAPTTAATGAVVHDTSMVGDGSGAQPLSVAPSQIRLVGSYSTGIGLNDEGMGAVVQHFVDATARTTAIPLPRMNQLTMLDNAPGVIWFWDGSAWKLQPNQTGWDVAAEFMPLSGAFTPGLPITMMVLQINTTTAGDGSYDVVPADQLLDRSGVISVQVQETGTPGWRTVIAAATNKIVGTAYRLADGTVMAGVPVQAIVTVIVY